jgi:hypothetical protein
VWGGGRKRESNSNRKKKRESNGRLRDDGFAITGSCCWTLSFCVHPPSCCVVLVWFDLVLSMAAIDPTDQRAIQQAIIKNLKQRYVNASITEILFQKHSDGYYHCFFEGCPHFLLGLCNNSTNNNNNIIIIINRDL